MNINLYQPMFYPQWVMLLSSRRPHRLQTLCLCNCSFSLLESPLAFACPCDFHSFRLSLCVVSGPSPGTPTGSCRLLSFFPDVGHHLRPLGAMTSVYVHLTCQLPEGRLQVSFTFALLLALSTVPGTLWVPGK